MLYKGFLRRLRQHCIGLLLKPTDMHPLCVKCSCIGLFGTVNPRMWCLFSIKRYMLWISDAYQCCFPAAYCSIRSLSVWFNTTRFKPFSTYPIIPCRDVTIWRFPAIVPQSPHSSVYDVMALCDTSVHILWKVSLLIVESTPHCLWCFLLTK